MLDIIRKKASDWGVKVIFGIIIVVFVFFFGYNRMTQRSKAGGKMSGVVAKVDGESITGPEFQLAYENTYKMYQNIFKGKEGEPMPAGIEKSVKSTALNQLIQQTVIKNLGKELDLDPSKVELVDAIKSSPAAKGEDGQFDPYLYKQRFLPYFAQKYGIDYETLVAGDLTAQNVQRVFDSSTTVPLDIARNIYNTEKTKFSFEVAEFDNDAAAKSGTGGKAKNVGPIGIAERNQLFASPTDTEIFEKVFSLTSTNPSLADPIKVGEKWYRIKLTKVDLPSESQWEKDKGEYLKSLKNSAGQEFFQTWLASLMKKAKVKTYIEE